MRVRWVLAVSVVAAALAPAAAGRAGPGPLVVVNPATDLLHGQVVTVTGSGFTPNASIGMSQCDAAGTNTADCDLSNVAYATADGAGDWSTSFTVRGVIHNSHTTIDCGVAPDICIISASNLANIGGEDAGAPISFHSNAPDGPSATATDGVPYTFSCGVGNPIVIHGRAPATVLPGDTFALTDVYLQYTSPITASYTGSQVTIPAPPGAAGSNLVIDIPETVNLDAGETYVSPPAAGTFVAANQPGTVIAFRPATLHIESASTVGGGSLNCSFSPGQPAFATTTIGAPATAARPIAATPSFTG